MRSNLDSSQPIYIQIAEIIEDEILKGNLEAGNQVMSTNELSDFYQINPATAGKGLNLLVEKGVLFKKRGLGTFVAEQAKEKVIKKRKKKFYEHQIGQLIKEAEKLNINRAELIKMIREFDFAEDNN